MSILVRSFFTLELNSLPLDGRWEADVYNQDCCVNPLINIYYSFDTGEYHESVGLVFTRVPQARA